MIKPEHLTHAYYLTPLENLKRTQKRTPRKLKNTAFWIIRFIPTVLQIALTAHHPFFSGLTVTI